MGEKVSKLRIIYEECFKKISGEEALMYLENSTQRITMKNMFKENPLVYTFADHDILDVLFNNQQFSKNINCPRMYLVFTDKTC